MNREELRALAEAEGFRLPAVRQRLLAYFQTPDGQAALSRAPRVYHPDGMRPMDLDQAVRGCLEEVARWRKERERAARGPGTDAVP